MYCKCGSLVPERRIEFLKKNNRPITCINCSTTPKVVGFQVIVGKTEREIQIVSEEQAAVLTKASARAGTGVSRGVKMDQSFKPKLFK